MDPSSDSFTGKTVTDRLKDMEITLPPSPKAAANYIPVQRSENLLFLSGHLPFLEDGKTLLTGRIRNSNPEDNSMDSTLHELDYGYKAARYCGLNLLSTLHDYLQGDWDRVDQIVKIFGIVQSHSDFHDQHKVMNGCSDLLVDVFGAPKGVHARSAIGTSNLPLNAAVEVEMIVRIKQ